MSLPSRQAVFALAKNSDINFKRGNIVTRLLFFVKTMDSIKDYCMLLKGLPRLSEEAMALLTEASEFTKSKQLTGLVGDVSHMDFAEPSLDLVRNLDVMARQRVRADLEGAECLWLLARLVEYVLSMKHRPFCKFCFRTVAVRSNGRLKDFCPMHASGTSSRDTAAYQRGRKHQADLEAYLEKLPKLSKGRGTDKLPHLDFLEWRLLSFQLNAFRKGGGSAGYIVTHLDWDAWIVGAPLNIDELRLPEIADDHPDWSELAWRWRTLFEDHEGVQQLGKGGVAATPRMLVEQWLRWKAWMVAGDNVAQVGKGRPAKINQEEALRLRAEGLPVSEIAKRYPTANPKSLLVFFSRWDLAHIDRDQAIRWRADGKTDEEIAARFKVSARSVAKVLSQGEVDSEE
jgi:hypothetical protein